MRAGIVVSFVSLIALTDVTDVQASQDTPRAAGTTISGSVFDSLANRGLAGANVQIANARDGTWSRMATADESGRFQFADVPIGTYLLGFFHPKLDSLSISSQTLRVDVRTEQPMQVRLAIPSARTLARSVCGEKSVSDSAGLLVGYLRSAETSMPRSGGSLNIRWAEVIIEKNSIRRLTPTVDVATAPTGSFAVCGLPAGTSLLVQAASASDSSGAFEITIPATGFLYRDVFLAPVVRTKVAGADSAPAMEVWRGTGRLRGRIVAATGRPIEGARVTVWGTGLETLTNSDGQFSLTDLPQGTHTLEARAVGFAPAQRAVDIVHGAGEAAAVELANLAIALDTIRVTAQRVYTARWEEEFQRRMKYRSGTGHLIDEKEIEKRNPLELTDILRTIPGVQVIPTARGNTPFMRGGTALGSGLCRPVVWIDGARVTNDEAFRFNSLVSASEIRAVEVYPHAALVPAEFQTLSGCGSIAIWTGMRRRG